MSDAEYYFDDTECDYVDEETGERKGCGLLASSGQCDDCQHDDFIASVGPEEHKRLVREEREKREREFQASLAWNRLTGSAQKPPANWREIIASAHLDVFDQCVKVVAR